MVVSTNFTTPKLQLAAHATDLNSSAQAAVAHQTTSAKNQTSRNAAMSGGSRKKQRGGDPMAGRITVSQGPAMASGSIPASPTDSNTNMVGTTQTSVGAQAQTQYDSQVNTSGKIPTSSSPRANKNPPPHVQEGGGVLEKKKDELGDWLSRLNQSAGGRRGRRRRTRKKRRSRRTRKRRSRKRVHSKTRKRGGAKPKKKKKKKKKSQKRSKAAPAPLALEDMSTKARSERRQLRHSRGVYTEKEQGAFAECTKAKTALKIDASTKKKAVEGIRKELLKK